MPAADPDLSIVVALISGRTEDLERCLAALASQEDVPPLEILVPYDEPCRDVLRLAAAFPAVRFIALEGVDTSADRAGAGREHHDLLRTLGIRCARGRFVILTEDHAHADPRWCASLLAAFEAHPRAACVGGAVEWGGTSLLSYAVYLCDFGRYQNPLPDAPAIFVSDSNVCYRREMLDATADRWQRQYRETIVHGELVCRGHELRLTPHAVVWQARTGLAWGDALRERFVWGRSYAGSRFPDRSRVKRFVFAALTPGLPLLLSWRYFSGAWSRRQPRGRLLLAGAPLVLLSAVWALGEMVGYLTGRSR